MEYYNHRLTERPNRLVKGDLFELQACGYMRLSAIYAAAIYSAATYGVAARAARRRVSVDSVSYTHLTLPTNREV